MQWSLAASTSDVEVETVVPLFSNKKLRTVEAIATRLEATSNDAEPNKKITQSRSF